MNFHDVLEYDPESGTFRWKHRNGMPKQWTKRYAGKPAGNVEPRGYVRIRIDGKSYYAHRIAWSMLGGADAKDIDHINGNRSDNRACNLRAATRSQNIFNQGRGDPSRGVHWNTKRKKFIAQISCDGVHHWLGEHDTMESAAQAFKVAAVKLYGEFACS